MTEDTHREPTGISDADWERINGRIASAKESGIAVGIDQARHPCDVRAFSERQIQGVILRTTERLPAGREFLLKILEADGVHGFDAFLQQANEAMREDGSLDFEDLKPHHADILKEVQALRRLKNPLRTDMTKRDFLSWGIAALATGAMAKNAVIGIDHAFNEEKEPKEHDHDSSVVQHTVHNGATVAEALAPTIEVGLAGVVLHDTLKDRTQEKMSQITRAIVLFSREARKGVQGLPHDSGEPGLSR